MTRFVTIRRSSGIAAALFLCAALISIAAAPAARAANLARLLTWEATIEGSEELDLRWPVALAAASSDRIGVADAFGPRLLVFRGGGGAWILEASVTLPGMPIGLAYDGERFVASLRGGRGLVAFEPPKLAQRRIGLPPGAVPGPLAALPDGGLLVYDYAGERVLELSPEGTLEREIKIEARVTALAATSAGGFFVTAGSEGTVERFDAAGKSDAVWRVPNNGAAPAWPSGIAVDPLGDVAVVDRHGERIVLLDNSGRAFGSGARRGWEPGLLRHPGAIALLPDGKLAVADQGNGRVQIFRRSDRKTEP
jgi:sugar lactone lactonase YvrE